MNEHTLDTILDFHARLAEKAAETKDLHKLVESIISETVNYMNAASGSIMVYDKQSNSLKLYVSSHHPAHKTQKSGLVAEIPVKEGIAGRVFESGRPIVVENAAQAEIKAKLRRKNDSGSFLSIPLKINKKLIGVMNLNRLASQKSFTDLDLTRLKAVDTMIASLIEKESLLDAIEENRREIAGLYEISSILSESNDFTGRLEEFLKKLSDELGLQRLAILKIKRNLDLTVKSDKEIEFDILAAHNLKPTLLQQMFKSVSARMQMQISQSQGLFSTESEVLRPPTLSFEEKDGNIHELFCIPLLVEGQPSHVLLVSRRYLEDDSRQAGKHYRFLYLVSQNLSMAIERENMIRLISEDQDMLYRTNQRNLYFLEISKDLTSTLDPYTILQKAFNNFNKVIGFTTISILLFDDIENSYRLIVQPDEPVSVGYQKKLTQQIFNLFSDFPSDPPLSQENFCKPIFFKPQTHHAKPAADYKHTLHLPIVIGDKVRGLIHLARRHNDPFNPSDLDSTSQFTGIFITSIKNALIHKRTEKLAFTDPLTELFNHRYFQETLSHEFTRAKRYTKPLSLMLIDIDFFKKFNDTYGHLVGDKVLRHVAAVFKNSVREQIDTVARYGGEEFAVILPETSIEGASRFAERIRAAVEESRVIDENRELAVTLSIGVACTSITSCEKPSDLIEASDLALYKAKDTGRNRVTTFKESRLKNA
ncbi:MAG: diguanylate cyclase [Candidatus Riflebacteria bacterium]|nr:diguanylate cyclase [Candidatus Riflebacteria bacterium]